MRTIIELKPIEINGVLQIAMNVYRYSYIVPRWSRRFLLYKASTEKIVGAFYDYYLYAPLLLCSKSKITDFKRWMSKWIAEYKNKRSIEGIGVFKYELDF